MTSIFKQLSLAAIATMLVAGPAAAEWPEKPITIIAPFSAGGGTDPVLRTLAAGLEERLGQPVLPDFRPGASSTIGTKMVLDAPADGYTLLITTTTPIADVKWKIDNLPYDIDDIQPIILITKTAISMIANADFEPNNLEELIEYSNANPGKVNVATTGVGGGGHSATNFMQIETGAKFNIIPYKGAGDMRADLMSGVVDIGVGFPASFIPGIEAGRLKMLGFLEPYSLAAFPGTQNFTDVGVAPVTFPAWFIIAGKKGIPQEVIDKVASATRDFLSTEEAKTKLEALGYEVITDGTTEEAVAAVDEWKANVPKLIESGAIVLNK